MTILLIPRAKSPEEAYAIGKRIHIMQNQGLEFSNIITAETRQHINTAFVINQYFIDKGLKELPVNCDESIDEQKCNESTKRAFRRCAKGAFANVEIFKNRGYKGIMIFITSQTLLQSLDHSLNNTSTEEAVSNSSMWRTGTPYLFSASQETAFKNAVTDMEQQGFFTGY